MSTLCSQFSAEGSIGIVRCMSSSTAYVKKLCSWVPSDLQVSFFVVLWWALHRYCQGRGFESCSGLNFFQALISQLLKVGVYLQWSIMTAYLSPQFKYMIFHIFICRKKNALFQDSLIFHQKFNLSYIFKEARVSYCIPWWWKQKYPLTNLVIKSKIVTLTTSMYYWICEQNSTSQTHKPTHSCMNILEYFRASESTKINLMRNNHRHKISLLEVE